MRNVQYDFSSSHVDVPDPLSNDIIQWGRKNITDNEIYVTQGEMGYGREDEIHITTLYGIHDKSPERTENIVRGTKPLKITLGKTKVFSNPHRYDVVIIDVVSEDLRNLNERLTKDLEHTNAYGSYKPHVTIAYVKKGKGWQHKNVALWEGESFEANYLVFSSINGTKTKIYF